MKKIIKRLGNLKTTIAGLILLSGAAVLLWFGKITMTDFMLILPTIAGLLWVKDTVLKP